MDLKFQNFKMKSSGDCFHNNVNTINTIVYFKLVNTVIFFTHLNKMKKITYVVI